MSRHHDFPSDSIEARAYRRVRRKMGFYWHLLIFVLVNGGLYIAHAVSGETHRPVVIWGWAVGLAIHGIVTFVSLHSEGVRERMIREEIERMKRERGDAGPPPTP
jgi:hypothetical protein